MSHVLHDHITHTSESCHSYEWAMPRIHMNHATHINDIYRVDMGMHGPYMAVFEGRQFSKICSLLNLLNSMTIKLTFQKFHQLAVPGAVRIFFANRLLLKFTVHNDYRADFWEILPVGCAGCGDDLHGVVVCDMYESCQMYEWVMAHIWMSHVTHMNASYPTYESVISYIWMSPVTLVNG